jgi:hypothetical protein
MLAPLDESSCTFSCSLEAAAPHKNDSNGSQAVCEVDITGDNPSSEEDCQCPSRRFLENERFE